MISFPWVSVEVLELEIQRMPCRKSISFLKHRVLEVDHIVYYCHYYHYYYSSFLKYFRRHLNSCYFDYRQYYHCLYHELDLVVLKMKNQIW